LEGANSAEFDQETPYPVVHLMPDQEGVENKGGTMRLGTYPCQLAPESLVRKYYGQELIDERHRHRYEINNDYRDLLQKHGLKISGLSPDQKLLGNKQTIADRKQISAACYIITQHFFSG
jgi:CTP synthase